ncbi:membrane protein [Pseudomonas syringae]|uniref:Membrane protein n=2 Tax=Pseudomonas syringae TaxID=317 RepID=A0A085VG23_PSESX|nr:membrane protein [Pseudomonas syringae]
MHRKWPSHDCRPGLLDWPGFSIMGSNHLMITDEIMTSKPPRSRISRLLFAALAYVSLGIGLVAIFIPGLPTTEFVLLAAWAATKSSPRLSAWLENHKLFGPILSNWRNGRLVTRSAKISATISMLVCAMLMLYLMHGWPVYAAIGGMVLGNLWIWSRPEPPRSDPLR